MHSTRLCIRHWRRSLQKKRGGLSSVCPIGMRRCLCCSSSGGDLVSRPACSIRFSIPPTSISRHHHSYDLCSAVTMPAANGFGKGVAPDPKYLRCAHFRVFHGKCAKYRKNEDAQSKKGCAHFFFTNRLISADTLLQHVPVPYNQYTGAEARAQQIYTTLRLNRPEPSCV